MNPRPNLQRCLWGALLARCTLLAPPAFADHTINGQVLGGGAPIASCFFGAPEAVSTRCGRQGVTVFFGMAKPVRAPQIGPAKPY